MAIYDDLCTWFVLTKMERKMFACIGNLFLTSGEPFYAFWANDLHQRDVGEIYV